MKSENKNSILATGASRFPRSGISIQWNEISGTLFVVAAALSSWRTAVFYVVSVLSEPS